MENKEFFGVGRYFLGISSIIFAFLNPLSGAVLGILGLVIEKEEKNSFSIKGRKLSLIGLIFGVIFFILTLVFIILSDLNSLIMGV